MATVCLRMRGMRTTVQPYSKSCAKIIMNVTAAPLIGQPVDRAEDLRFLTGAGKFVDDLTRDGILHAVVLRSGVAHGRIKRLDTSAARARPGVHAVITAAEIGANVPVIPLRLANLPEFAPYLQPVIASDKVRYVGEPVAVVVAESQALAEDATEAINLEIERLPALPDRHAAASGTALLFEATSSNRAVRYSVAFGDADAAFAKAEYTRRESFRCHRLTAVPLETRGLIAEWDATKGKLTDFGATKVLFFNRRVLAPMLGLAENAIDMIEPDVGGVSLPKTRFVCIDGGARQESDAQQPLRSARLGVCRACPSQAKREFAFHYNRWHISQEFVEGDVRRPRSHDQCTHAGSTRSIVQHTRSARASGTTWAGPGCPLLGCEL